MRKIVINVPEKYCCGYSPKCVCLQYSGVCPAFKRVLDTDGYGNYIPCPECLKATVEEKERAE